MLVLFVSSQFIAQIAGDVKLDSESSLYALNVAVSVRALTDIAHEFYGRRFTFSKRRGQPVKSKTDECNFSSKELKVNVNIIFF